MTFNTWKLSAFYFTLAISCSACGGGDTDSPAQATDMRSVAANSATDTTPTDDLASLVQPSRWSSFAADRPAIATLASSPNLSFSAHAELHGEGRLIVSASFALQHWETMIEPALEAGQLLVIESLTSDDGEREIEELTTRYLGMGLVGKAVMLSKISGHYQVAGFGTHEIPELINAMRASRPTAL